MLSNMQVRDQIIVGVVASILVIMMFYFFAWKPQSELISNKNQEIAAVDAEIQKNKDTLQIYREAKEQAPQIEEKLLDMEVEMPSKPGVPQLVKQLTDLANYSGLQLESLSVSPPSPTTGYTVITVNMPMKGTYFDVIDFLYRAYYNPRAFYINSVSLAPADYPMLTVGVSGSVFSYLASGDTGTTTGGDSTIQ